MEVQQNQTVFDICLQEFGTLENLFDDVISPNKINLDREIKTGQTINVNSIDKGVKSIKDQIKEGGLIFTNVDISSDEDLIGIGYDIIEDTLIVG